jgi:hypothetical protein
MAKMELRKFLSGVCGANPEWHDMMVARNRFSSQNGSPKEPVGDDKNIVTSGENTYRKACIERKKATLQISILIPLLVGAARSRPGGQAQLHGSRKSGYSNPTRRHLSN